MKQCVKCRLLYADENLRFCRFDGSPLVKEITPPEEAATILFTSGQLNHLILRSRNCAVGTARESLRITNTQSHSVPQPAARTRKPDAGREVFVDLILDSVILVRLTN